MGKRGRGGRRGGKGKGRRSGRRDAKTRELQEDIESQENTVHITEDTIYNENLQQSSSDDDVSDDGPKAYDLLLSSFSGVKSRHDSLLKRRAYEAEGKDEDDVAEAELERMIEERLDTQRVKKKRRLMNDKVEVVEREEEVSDDGYDLAKKRSEILEKDKVDYGVDYENDDGTVFEDSESKDDDVAIEEDDEGTDPYDIHFDSDKMPVFEKAKGKLVGNMLERNIFSTHDDELPPVANTLSNFFVKNRLIPKWEEHYQKKYLTKSRRKKLNNEQFRKEKMRIGDQLTEKQQMLFSVMSKYKDLLYIKDREDSADTMSLYSLHALNHVLKRRDRISKHNSKIRGFKLTGEFVDVEFRDQGFTRPTVLIICPTRNKCFEIVNEIIRYAPPSVGERISNKKKFHSEFYSETYVPFTPKPDDWFERFKGNIDDCFRVGLSIGRKNINLYSEFYHSDIIIASPLGMKLVLEEKKNSDFLSSIEMLIIDDCDYYLMQNFDHLESVLEELNKIPEEYRDTDISRIKMWFLEEKAKDFRQTICISEVLQVRINSIMNKYTSNYEGMYKFLKDHNNESNFAIAQVVPKVEQLFQRIEVKSFSELSDARYEYFVTKVYPYIRSDLQKGVLIFVPSYFDYVRVRNFLRKKRKTRDLTFVQCCEYTPGNHVSRNRSNFYHGKRDWMLYTERFHFFNRYAIRGIKKIVFYSPPIYGDYYTEMLNLLPPHGSSLMLFTKFDVMQIEPLIGAERTQRLILSEKNIHLFFS
eukprot:TRINITY_DN4111_c0_g1_i1.p1 TRINITY_DN4111_c0_g1~~TRINITY_DN4111_c0_g1_i1.p1  ORF type:complete len:755 (+),score=165.76 TRINITY_DN4111_c0_g1_i1:111-2375(+)